MFADILQKIDRERHDWTQERQVGGLERRARETVEQYRMLDPGDQVVAAVLGGAGFVCLLTLLCTFREPWGVRLKVLHIHHGLRGEETDRDADFVRSLCKGFHVPCRILKVDVYGSAAEKGMSEEEADRLLRYETLEREAADWEDEDRAGPDGDSADSSVCPVKIAVAHHDGDQMETVLRNPPQGSGLSGMKGIVYRRSRIIRSLLDMDRDRILEWLADHGLSYMQGSTNGTFYYTRNRIRNQLLPEVEQYVSRGATGNILRLGHLAAQADEHLKDQVTTWIKTYMRKNSGVYAPTEALLGGPEILRSCVVVSLPKKLGEVSKDLGLVHVSQVMELVGRSVGKQADLPYGLAAIREHEGTWMGRGDPVVEEGWGDLPIVDMEAFSWKKGVKSPKNVYTKWFGCDKIKDTPVVRTRRPGDHVVLADHDHKTLNRFMIGEKIPRQMRDKMPLLADGNYVIWIIGYRMSEYRKIGPDTVWMLQAEAGQTRGRKE